MHIVFVFMNCKDFAKSFAKEILILMQIVSGSRLALFMQSISLQNIIFCIEMYARGHSVSHMIFRRDIRFSKGKPLQSCF